MEFTAWIIVWYRESGIQIQSTREVKRSTYWGQTMMGFFFHPDRGSDLAEGNLHDVIGKSGENYTQAQNKNPCSDIVPAAKGCDDDKQLTDEKFRRAEIRKHPQTHRKKATKVFGIRPASTPVSLISRLP